METKKTQGNRSADKALRMYFHDDFSVPNRRHPFMSEVAHLAWHRGLTQGKLAKCYSEAAGTKTESRNANAHMHTKPGRLSRKVMAGYAKALKMSETYVGLLMALDTGKPYFTPKPGSFGEYALLDHLRPEDARPLYEDGALDKAIELLQKNEKLALRCVDDAELAWCRHQAFGKPEEDEAAVKWRAVAKILQVECGYDLAGKATKKSSQQLKVEETLASVFNLLAYAGLGWYEWEAVRAQLEANFHRRELPVEDMRRRLHEDFSFQEWADVHDPERFLAENEQSRK